MRTYTQFLFLAGCLLLATQAWSQTLTCSSDDGKRHTCKTDTRSGMQLVHQRSGSPCTQGYSWDFDDRGVWVDHGCRADFAPGVGPAPVAGGKTISCSSDDMGRHYCNAETRAGVQMVRQRSGSPCRKDYSWGFDDRGIWVDHGCRADFALETGPAPQEESCSQTMGQARAYALAEQCRQVSQATHPPCNVQNSCTLIRDEIQRGCDQLRGRGAPGFCSSYR